MCNRDSVPRAIAETWLRLGAIVSLRNLPDAGPDLAPEQLGVGIPGGAENIGNAIKTAISTDPANTIVLSHDWANAFNSVSGARLFEVLPFEVLPFVNLVYGAHSTVHFVPHHPSGPIDITFFSGVRQGDPLRPLLLALMMQQILKAVSDAHPQVHPIAYTDDTYLIGHAEAISAAFPTLVCEGAAIGLRPSLHKCKVYGTPNTPAFAAALKVSQTLHITHAKDGFVAARTPIGPIEYQTQKIMEHADHTIALIKKLQDLHPPLTTQNKFLLLSRSLHRKLTHFTCVCPPHAVSAPLRKLQAAVEDAAFAILNISTPSRCCHGPAPPPGTPSAPAVPPPR